MTILYGISNCDTVRKARRWLDEHKVDYRFHDFRKDGLERQQLATWLETLGSEQLINRRSSSWKGLSEAEREQINAGDGLALILEQPTLIKRPLLEHQGQPRVGFKADDYAALFE